MIDPEEATEDATVIDFFARMNAEGVDYALLRNYELFPSFGHDIDLIVRWSDLPKWKAIARSCAVDRGWDALTECDHWAQSGSREHTIHILRFYAMPPPRYLQIDAFHSFLLLGLPFFDEDALLRGRVWDERGFYRIDVRLENLFRLLQVARLAGIGGAEEKLKSYRDRALSFWDAADLSAFAASAGLSGIAPALEALRAGDFKRYKRKVDRQKLWWWIAALFSHPWRGSKAIVDRLVDYLRLYWLRPCGFTVRVFAAKAEQRGRLESAMQQLVRANLVPAFTAGAGLKEKLRVLERGGVVIEWECAERADVVLGGDAEEEFIVSTFASLIRERHPRIFEQGNIPNR